MNETPHEPNQGYGTNMPLDSCDDISGKPELRTVRPRRRPAKRVSASRAESPITVDKVEASLQTVGANPVATSAFRKAYRGAIASAQQALCWLRARRAWQLQSRRLRLCETISLGDKRFVAIVRVDDQHFLLGGASSNVSMLAQLSRPDDFAAVLQQRRKRGGTVA